MELLRIKSEYLTYSDHLYQIYRGQAVEALFSELNNIYVSLTRAEEEMYVFVPERAGTSINLLNLLIPENLAEVGDSTLIAHSSLQKPMSHHPSSISNDEISILPVSLYRDWISYLNEEFSPERESLINREKIKRGKELHELLSTVGNLKNREESIDVCRGGFQTLPYELTEIVEKKELKFLFYIDGEVFNEKEIVDKHGHTKRIDRLIVTDKEVLIVDYKSARAAKSEERRGKGEEQKAKSGLNPYYQQVKDYMGVVGEMYPGRSVKGYLVYLDSLEVEEIKNSSEQLL